MKVVEINERFQGELYRSLDEAANYLGTTAKRLLNIGVLGQIKLLAPVLNPGIYAWTPDEDDVEWGLGLRKLDLTVHRRFGLTDRVFLGRDDLAKIEARGWAIPKKFSAPTAASDEFWTWEARAREGFGACQLTAHERYFATLAFHNPWQLTNARAKRSNRIPLKFAPTQSATDRTTLKHLFIPIEEVQRLARKLKSSSSSPIETREVSRMLSLHDAQGVLRGRPNDLLLRKAAEGATALWIKVPRGYEVYGANREMQRFGAVFDGLPREPRSQDEGDPFTVNVDYLALAPTDCAKLLTQASVVKRGFFDALVWADDSWEITKKIPALSLSGGQEPWTHIEQFFLRSAGQSYDLDVDQFEELAIDRSSLYVLAADIEPYRSTVAAAATEPSVVEAVLGTREEERDDWSMSPHMSERLKTLIKLSERWKDMPFDENRSKDDYRSWHDELKEDRALRYNFPGRVEVARFGVDFIRPVYARWSIPSRIDGSIVMDFRSPELRALIEASKKWEGWKAPAPLVKKEDIAAVIAEYMSARGFRANKTLLEHGPKIVQPEAADSGREKQGMRSRAKVTKK